jgi:hypothetical protein
MCALFLQKCLKYNIAIVWQSKINMMSIEYFKKIVKDYVINGFKHNSNNVTNVLKKDKLSNPSLPH